MSPIQSLAAGSVRVSIDACACQCTELPQAYSLLHIAQNRVGCVFSNGLSGRPDQQRRSWDHFFFGEASKRSDTPRHGNCCAPAASVRPGAGQQGIANLEKAQSARGGDSVS